MVRKFPWLTAALVVLGLTAVCPAQFPDLIYYKFNEGTGVGGTTANVAAPGVGSALAPVNGAHSLTPGVGQFGGGLTAAAASSTANFVDSGWVTALGSTGFTISFWADVSFAATATLQYVFGDSTAGSFRCFYNGAAGAGSVMIRGGGLTDTFCAGAGVGGGHTVTFVYDATANVCKSFLDGALVSTVAQGAVNVTGTGNLRVAAYNTSTFSLSVLLDEFRVYSYALTDAQVMATAGVELFDINVLNVSQSGPGVGDLSISLTNLSPTATSGWLILSAEVGASEGSGPFIGIYPDANTWLLFLTTPMGTGNPFHFPTVAPLGFFPVSPFNVGPGGVSSLTGLTVDVAMLMAKPGPNYDSKSNVVRFTFQ
jgi:hypothetical protein